jgi:hypothetical protein
MATPTNSLSGDGGANDLNVAGSTSSWNLDAKSGDDVVRGGKSDDIIIGGAGDDILSGGGGADQFRFFGSQYEGDGGKDTDRLVDLNFGQGDSLVFGGYGAIWHDDVGENAFNNGNSAIISSWEGLKNAVENSEGAITVSFGAGNLLIIQIHFGEGEDDHTQELRISNGASAYQNAGEVLV